MWLVPVVPILGQQDKIPCFRLVTQPTTILDTGWSVGVQEVAMHTCKSQSWMCSQLASKILLDLHATDCCQPHTPIDLWQLGNKYFDKFYRKRGLVSLVMPKRYGKVWFSLYDVVRKYSGYHNVISYSRKIWWGIKFGGLAVLGETPKFIYTTCMYVCSRPPNLNPQIHGLGANRQI